MTNTVVKQIVFAAAPVIQPAESRGYFRER